jgi:hypothetical protein
VTYDANLICPVLLVSKCVIFNWKDSMQKDKILNQLGILHKAAINVACEDESLTDEADGQKLFGHLHLVFRDWQYEGSDEKSVYNDIFKEERSAETAAAVRNQIRRSVKENFESITVWLFPAPVKDSAQLSTRLSYDVTQESFKRQLGLLRGKLSSQLVGPSVFDGQPLRGNTIGAIVETIATVLNTGDAVRPKPAWVSMICSEIEQTRIAFEKTLRRECDKMLEAFERRCLCSMTSNAPASRRLSTGDVNPGGNGRGGKPSSSRASLNIPARAEPTSGNTLVSSSFPRWDQAEQSLRGKTLELFEDYKADVDAISGGGAALAPDDLIAIEAALQRSIESEKAHFTAKFSQLCTRWVRSAKETCLRILESECQELQVGCPFVDSELSEAMAEFFTEVTLILRERLEADVQYIHSAATATATTAAASSKPKSSKAAVAGGTGTTTKLLNDMKLIGCEADKIDIEETLKNLHQAADLQFQVVRHVNDESKRRCEAACRTCLSDAQVKLEANVDNAARGLLSSSVVVTKAELNARLDEEFKAINDALWESVTAMPLGEGFVEGFQKELERTGLELVRKIETLYSKACHKFVKKIVTETNRTITAQTEYLLECGEPVTEEHLVSIYQEIVNKEGDIATRQVSQWTLEV